MPALDTEPLSPLPLALRVIVPEPVAWTVALFTSSPGTSSLPAPATFASIVSAPLTVETTALLLINAA